MSFAQSAVRLMLVVGACGMAAGCTGGADDPATGNPAGANRFPQSASATLPPEGGRLQDQRRFTLRTATLPFAALPGAPQADQWSGVLDGAGFRIEVPARWNGVLVMYAHGYVGPGSDLQPTLPPLRRHLLDRGYAWAASTYSRNYYDVRAGLTDTNHLARAFVRLAGEHGRTIREPERIFIVGHSMGGHVAAAAIEQETRETATEPVTYAGALPMCGVLGDQELFNYAAAYQLAALKLADQPAEQWPIADWAERRPAVEKALFERFPSQDAPGRLTPQGEILLNLVQHLSGGVRPLFREGFLSPGTATAWNLFRLDGTVDGILARNGVSTVGVTYRLGTSRSLSAEDVAFNDSILRIHADPKANPLRTDGVRWLPVTPGQLTAPVLTLHELGDMFVPFSMEQVYRRRVELAGKDDLLVQRAIRSTGHCDFTLAEQIRAFDDLVQWVDSGTPPAGDDVLDTRAVARADFGCAFSNPRTSDEDLPQVALQRRLADRENPCPTTP